jgi:hypothetical protein
MRQDSSARYGTTTSLDVLQYEDLFLRDLFVQIRSDQEPLEVVDDDSRGASVLRRYRYGEAAKQALRHLAIRQSAAMDVARAIATVADLGSTAAKIIQRGTACRVLINELREVVRHHALMNLNTGTDFALRMAELMDMADETIDWELSEAIPLIEKVLPGGSPVRFRNARYIRNHAPTKLDPTGPQWYERAPLVSRLLTVYDHLLEVQM